MSTHFPPHGEFPYPHSAGCTVCRELGRCDVCGGPAPRGQRCTNGRCPSCHSHVCGSGGATGPGHGYGARERALAYHAARNTGR